MKTLLPMQYPLYELYSRSSLDLYEVRKHFLEHFYYQNHSRNAAENVLRNIVSSSKVSRIIEESFSKLIVPSYMDFLTVINSMFKFMLRSNDTQVLATIDAALRWDIEVNAKLHLTTSEELKQDIIKVFQKNQVYKELTNEDLHSFSVSTSVDMEPVEETGSYKRLPKLRTWSLEAFTDEFGRMKVGEYVNSDTGETFHSCVFTNGYTRTFVSFSSKLGELTPEEIKDRKNELVVVKLPNDKYCLAKKGRSHLRNVDI